MQLEDHADSVCSYLSR